MWKANRNELQWINDENPLTIAILAHPGFDSYIRILHPAQRIENGSAEYVGWSDIAVSNGSALQGDSSYDDISPPLSLSHLEMARPSQGEMPDFMMDRLIAVLSCHTRTPARCTFMFHSSWFYVPVPEEMTEIKFRAERYLVAGGSCDELARFPISPSLWWPEDRAWLVASPLDTEPSFVGCGYSAAQSLLADPGLETRRVDGSASFGGL